jgi:hypothetical protein
MTRTKNLIAQGAWFDEVNESCSFKERRIHVHQLCVYDPQFSWVPPNSAQEYVYIMFVLRYNFS